MRASESVLFERMIQAAYATGARPAAHDVDRVAHYLGISASKVRHLVAQHAADRQLLGQHQAVSA